MDNDRRGRDESMANPANIRRYCYSGDHTEPDVAITGAAALALGDELATDLVPRLAAQVRKTVRPLGATTGLTVADMKLTSGKEFAGVLTKQNLVLIALPEECGEPDEDRTITYAEPVTREEPEEETAVVVSSNYTPAARDRLSDQQARFDERMTAAVQAHLKGKWMGREWSWLSEDSLLGTRFNGQDYNIGLEREDRFTLHLIVCLTEEN